MGWKSKYDAIAFPRGVLEDTDAGQYPKFCWFLFNVEDFGQLLDICLQV